MQVFEAMGVYEGSGGKRGLEMVETTRDGRCRKRNGG